MSLTHFHRDRMCWAGTQLFLSVKEYPIIFKHGVIMTLQWLFLYFFIELFSFLVIGNRIFFGIYAFWYFLVHCSTVWRIRRRWAELGMAGNANNLWKCRASAISQSGGWRNVRFLVSPVITREPALIMPVVRSCICALSFLCISMSWKIGQNYAQAAETVCKTWVCES